MVFDTKFLRIDGRIKRFVRFENHVLPSPDRSGKHAFEIESRDGLLPKGDVKKAPKKHRNDLRRYFWHGSTKIHSEGFESKQTKVWDPRTRISQIWNNIFLFSCVAVLFIDPLFYYLPVVSDAVCLEIDNHLAVAFTILRTITDMLYLVHMIIQFRTGFIVPSAHVLGEGDLITDPALIAKRYLTTSFVIDLVAVLPLPQVVTWVIIPSLKKSTPDTTKDALRLIILLQLVIRLFPLFKWWSKSSGLTNKTALGGAAYNLLLYMLISHLFGACWYLLSVERQDTCWRQVGQNIPGFETEYLDCRTSNDMNLPFNMSDIQANCTANGNFQFGIFQNALLNGVVMMMTNQFIVKYFYCFWWGLQTLSTLGQGLQPSLYVGETIFSIALTIVGLTLFARLLDNMKTYLQSSVRVEEMRIKRNDMEQWMQHRQLPQDLRKHVRSYEQYKWVETRGVNEDELVINLPKDLRRDVKRHLCINLVKGVPFFGSMDDRLLDAICECLQPTLFTTSTNVVREGDPVNEMIFVIRGYLKSETTNGGRTGFLNVGRVKPGQFCGEELLTWALDPKSEDNLPSSTRSVSAETEVEAFALKAEDLKYVASQFRRLHSKQVQHTFRHYSQQWQTWAACLIQVAWRRYKRRKVKELCREEKYEEQQTTTQVTQGESAWMNVSLGTALYASRFAVNAMRRVHRLRELQAAEENISNLKLRKPSEPDFSIEGD